jgi:hypothetical protein
MDTFESFLLAICALSARLPGQVSIFQSSTTNPLYEPGLTLFWESGPHSRWLAVFPVRVEQSGVTGEDFLDECFELTPGNYPEAIRRIEAFWQPFLRPAIQA